MIATGCAFCAPRDPQRRQPKISTEVTAHGIGSLDTETFRSQGRAVIRSCRGDTGVSLLDGETTFVHITGIPFLWLIEEILKAAPNLKTIQVIPSMLSKMHKDSHLRLCSERGVTVQAGHVRPEQSWGEDENRVSSHYEAQRQFLLRLVGEQQKLFEELRAMCFEAAQMTVRYFCLDGQPYAPQRVVAEEFGYSASLNHVVSAKVNATLHYLDSGFATGAISKRISRSMRGRVARLRPYLESVTLRQKLADRLGISALSQSFPLSRVEVLEGLLKSKRDGRLERLEREHANAHRAVVLRFGLDGQEGSLYRSLQEVGEIMNGVTRERARQLEERALQLLGIADD